MIHLAIKALELSFPRQTSRKQIPGLTNSDHKEHGNKRTEDVDNENNAAIYLFGKYGVWNCEKETFISMSVFSDWGSHVVPVRPNQSKSTPQDRGTTYSV